jgi:hypothetical protein
MSPWEFAGGSLRRLAIGAGCAIPFAVWILTGNVWLGIVTFVAVIVVMKQVANLFGSSSGDMDAWLDSVSGCPYRSASESSGIALDIHARIIHLTQNFGGKQGQVTKAYPFEQVRDAHFGERSASPPVLGGHELMKVGSKLDAMAIRLDVADPDYPRWLIRLPPNDPLGLSGWLELLREKLAPEAL